jgi:hypothetical protein
MATNTITISNSGSISSRKAPATAPGPAPSPSPSPAIAMAMARRQQQEQRRWRQQQHWQRARHATRIELLVCFFFYLFNYTNAYLKVDYAYEWRPPKTLVSHICSDRPTPTLTILLRQLLRSRTTRRALSAHVDRSEHLALFFLIS